MVDHKSIAVSRAMAQAGLDVLYESGIVKYQGAGDIIVVTEIIEAALACAQDAAQYLSENPASHSTALETDPQNPRDA